MLSRGKVLLFCFFCLMNCTVYVDVYCTLLLLHCLSLHRYRWNSLKKVERKEFTLQLLQHMSFVSTAALVAWKSGALVVQERHYCYCVHVM